MTDAQETQQCSDSAQLKWQVDIILRTPHYTWVRGTLQVTMGHTSRWWEKQILHYYFYSHPIHTHRLTGPWVNRGPMKKIEIMLCISNRDYNRGQLFQRCLNSWERKREDEVTQFRNYRKFLGLQEQKRGAGINIPKKVLNTDGGGKAHYRDCKCFSQNYWLLLGL